MILYVARIVEFFLGYIFDFNVFVFDFVFELIVMLVYIVLEDLK